MKIHDIKNYDIKNYDIKSKKEEDETKLCHNITIYCWLSLLCCGFIYIIVLIILLLIHKDELI